MSYYATARDLVLTGTFGVIACQSAELDNPVSLHIVTAGAATAGFYFGYRAVRNLTENVRSLHQLITRARATPPTPPSVQP